MNLFRLVGSIFIDTAEANNSLAKTDDAAENTGKKFADVAKKAMGVGTAIVGGVAAVGGAVVKMASDSAEAADVVDKGSQRMNISTDSYQELAHAAGLCGVEMATLEKAAKKLEGTDLNLDQALEEIYALGTAEERSAKAAELFGESVAYTMSPMLNASADDMATMRQEAHDLGLVMSEENVTAGAALNDTLGNIKDAFGALVVSLGSSLMPIVQEFGNVLLQLLPVVQGGMEAISPILQMIFSTIMPPIMSLVQTLLPILVSLMEIVAAVLQPVFAILQPIFNVVNAIIQPLLTLVNVILQKVLTLLQPVIDLLMVLLQPLLDLINLILPPIISLGTKLAELLVNTIGKAVGVAVKIFENLRDVIKRVFEQIVNFVRKPVNTVIGFINGLIRGIVGGVNGVIRALNRFQVKVPNWITKLTGIQQFGFNLAEVSAPQIPYLAKGGDASEEGSAIVGEQGAELVQLPKGARVSPLGDKIEDKLDLIADLQRQFLTAFANMGVYIDGSALVGAIGNNMDRELGRIANRAERWA